MSYILGKNKLQIGYWLAKNIIFEDKKIQKKEITRETYKDRGKKISHSITK